ncbi:MAG: hypothetical protein MI702_13265 [Chlorobiales bacterium]|nr:hypothetical protein [Chlorobiales bacterium]
MELFGFNGIIQTGLWGFELAFGDFFRPVKLAKLPGIDPDTIRVREKLDRIPKRYNLIKLHEALWRISYEYLEYFKLTNHFFVMY